MGSKGGAEEDSCSKNQGHKGSIASRIEHIRQSTAWEREGEGEEGEASALGRPAYHWNPWERGFSLALLAHTSAQSQHITHSKHARFTVSVADITAFPRGSSSDTMIPPLPSPPVSVRQKSAAAYATDPSFFLH